MSYAQDTAAIEGSVPQLSSSREATWDVVNEQRKTQREASVEAALVRTLARLNGQLQLLEGLVEHCESCGGNDCKRQEQ